jgi:hypothetical protein
MKIFLKLTLFFIIGYLVGYAFVSAVRADIGGPPVETPYLTPEPSFTAVPVTPEPTILPTLEPTAEPTPDVTPQVTLAPSPSLTPEEEDIVLDKKIVAAIAENKEAIALNNALINVLILLIVLATLTLLVLVVNIRRLNKSISEWTDFNWEE